MVTADWRQQQRATELKHHLCTLGSDSSADTLGPLLDPLQYTLQVYRAFTGSQSLFSVAAVHLLLVMPPHYQSYAGTTGCPG